MKPKYLIFVGLISFLSSCKDTIDEDIELQELMYKGEIEYKNYKINISDSSKSRNYQLTVFKDKNNTKTFEYYLSEDCIETFSFFENDSLSKITRLGQNEIIKTYFRFNDHLSIMASNEVFDVYKFQKLSDRKCYEAYYPLSIIYFSPQIGLLAEFENRYVWGDKVQHDSRYSDATINELFHQLNSNRAFFPDEKKMNEIEAEKMLNFMKLENETDESEIHGEIILEFE
ncbi:hypothetical protein KMW28_14285 [Flammeovirga yaeyamensis]|uniref:Lipoprotein n=1 Tax=Flammeovirga yaeyamensis TaxID=367791 RepID=A0AAX1MZX7_9BACT|nr:hypothetical protein [Flammeovirga yaeyamensis]MBB3700245.1 hypothetical protein [Flammeovirga yaeyamensis]NMF37129.1 hypothetical protein [Flammeovirga yaeyamensis]QWG00820.1 hypothetical protein KMW28_14285 [Flammeovirga yaeyamensis]